MAKQSDATVSENATVDEEVKEVVAENAPVVEEPVGAENETTSVEVKHFMKKGILAIGDTQYEVKNGKVQVSPEHEALINEHISMIKG